MNKKKIFNRTLYMEGIRQLKIIGLIFFIIYILEAILIPLNQVQRYFNQPPHSIMIGINDIHPVIYLTFTVMAPLFTLYLFRFLTRRDSSDLYHSIPHTRTCLYISFIAAIITWMAAVLFISSGISICIYLCMPEIYFVNFSMVIPYLIGIFIASIGVVCGIALAQCITGSILTNIIVSGIILFFPRLLTTVITQSILDKTYNLIPDQYFMPALNGKYNLITCLFFNQNSIDISIFTKYSSWIYTIVLSLAYFALGLYLFNKRNSESAGISAPNKRLQAVYRNCTTLTFCLLPIWIICNESAFTKTEIFTIYCVAAVIYFLFEIITTKTVRNLLKIIPGLIIIVILNICIILFINTVSSYELNLCPEASEVSYIKSITNESDSTYVWYSSTSAYKFSDILYENIEINDEDIIEEVLENLKSDIDNYKSNPYYYNNDLESFRTFAIHTKNGRTYYRTINFKSKTSSASGLSAKLSNYLSDNTEYKKSLEELPKFNDVSANILSVNATKSQKKEIYNAFLEDYAAFTLEEKADFIESVNSYENIGNMQVSFYVNGKYAYIFIPITPDIPNTFNTYLKYFYNDDTIKDMKNILSDIENYVTVNKNLIGIEIENEKYNMYFDFTLQNNDVVESSYPDNQDDIIKCLSGLADFIPENSAKFKDHLEHKDNQKFIKITIYNYTIDYEQKFIFLPLTEETDKLCETLHKIYSSN